MAFDWPLSREEKKLRILQLYDKDVREAERLLRVKEGALASLQDELHGLRGSLPAVPAASTAAPTHADEQQRLRDAATVLEALLHDQLDMAQAEQALLNAPGDEAAGCSRAGRFCQGPESSLPRPRTRSLPPLGARSNEPQQVELRTDSSTVWHVPSWSFSLLLTAGVDAAAASSSAEKDGEHADVLADGRKEANEEKTPSLWGTAVDAAQGLFAAAMADAADEAAGSIASGQGSRASHDRGHVALETQTARMTCRRAALRGRMHGYSI